MIVELAAVTGGIALAVFAVTFGMVVLLALARRASLPWPGAS